jgi:hypothetical protein
MKQFNLQQYAAKDYNGLVTKSNLGALYQKDPVMISNVIHQIYRVNLGTAMFDWYNQFPVVEAPEGEFYYWDLIGQHEKNVPLLDWYVDDSGTKTAEPGVAGTSFFMEFGEPYFEPGNVLKGNKEEFQLLVSNQTQKGSNFVYEVELITSDPSAYVDVEELEAGTRWSKFGNYQPNTLSYRGQKPNFTSPFRMKNITSTLRMEYEVPGNMIGEGKNYPLKFEFPDPKNTGKSVAVWINYLDMVAKYQFDMAKVSISMYGRHNFTDNDIFLNKDKKNGFPIEIGAGLFEQISPSNQLSYGEFDLDLLSEAVMDLSIGRIEMGKRVVTLCTGEYGIRDFSRAVQTKVNSDSAVSRTLEYIEKSSTKLNGIKNALGYGYQYVNYYAYNGIIFELMYCPLFDNRVLFPEEHPKGGTVESRRFVAMDIGGEAGVKRVVPRGFTEVFKYFPGMRDPFSVGGKGSNPGPAVSKVDGYEVHGMWQGGLMVTDPTKMIDMKCVLA